MTDISEFAGFADIELAGKSLAVDTMKDIDEIKITDVFERMDQASFALSDPDFIYQDIFIEGKPIKIILGHLFGFKKTFRGEISGLEPDFPESGVPTLTVECSSKAKKGHEKQEQKNWQNKTASDIVSEFAIKHGWETEIEATTKIYPSLLQAGETDIEFILKLAAKENYYFKILGNMIIFKKRVIPQFAEFEFWYRAGNRMVKRFKPRFSTVKKGKQVKAKNINERTGEVVNAVKTAPDKTQTMGKEDAQEVTKKKTVDFEKFFKRSGRRGLGG